MAMLETTPYRVFYLINCPENTPDFRFIWGLDVERTSDTQINRYTSIVATMKVPNDFSSVVVEAMDITEYRVLDSESGTRSDQKSYKSYSPMPWNDMDEKIVSLIEGMYERSDNEGYGRRERQIAYADSIQRLFESPDSIRLSVDEHGNPKVEVHGLPYLYKAGKSDEASVVIDGSVNPNDYTYTIDMGSDYYKPVTFTGRELHGHIYQSIKYDEVVYTMKRLLGLDYEYDDWDD